MKKKNDRYLKFKRKLFSQILLVVFIAIAFVLFLNSILTGRFGEFFTQALQRVLNIDYEEAFYIYHSGVRGNKFIIVFLTALFMILIIFKVLISFMSRYFDEISDGLDILIGESEEEIKLSEEMEFLEKRLNRGKKILKERDEEIKNVEKRKNDLIMYLAHDVKTPLTSIIGYLNLLKDMKDIEEEKKEKYLDLVLDKTYHLENLINEIFDITKLNSKDLILNEERFNLKGLLNELLSEFKLILKEKNKKIVLEVPEEIEMYGDIEKLSRAFKNLIKNAIFYSHENSDIVIRAYISDEFINVEFENKADIMSKKDLENIFDKFYRLDKSRSSKTGGSGLGLAITKEIIEAHSGEIKARSIGDKIIFEISIKR
ncbi:MAG: HAMP domain-containing sensor histidine kinase [Peptostreptococcus sp.]|uniref:sensor histidine kinase n=1 Tax=Peptostreptococcus sp. TaxID=1262 RepID=UPI002FC715C7